jgi:hypothetical protein
MIPQVPKAFVPARAGRRVRFPSASAPYDLRKRVRANVTACERSRSPTTEPDNERGPRNVVQSCNLASLPRDEPDPRARTRRNSAPESAPPGWGSASTGKQASPRAARPPVIPSMRTLGGKVVARRWGRSPHVLGGLSETFKADCVAVLLCCTALGVAVMPHGQRRWVSCHALATDTAPSRRDETSPRHSDRSRGR